MCEGTIVIFLLVPTFLGREGWSFSLLQCHHGHKASSCLGFQGSSKDVVLYIYPLSLFIRISL